MNKAIGTLALALSLSACSLFAPQGTGGIQEYRLEGLYPVEPKEPIGPGHGLRFDFELLSRHLDVLVLEGAELCFPATVVQAKKRQGRIAREIAGGLDHDAANDIIVQRGLLSRLERQLDYVQAHDICVIPKVARAEGSTGQQYGDQAAYLAELLNADNQFAYDNADINPKYMARLAEAAVILREHTGYQLNIVGHADVHGEDAYNQDISLQRAQQVARYLQIMGVPQQRMTVSASGEHDPLYQSQAPQNRLVNRRVNIEVIAGQAEFD